MRTIPPKPPQGGIRLTHRTDCSTVLAEKSMPLSFLWQGSRLDFGFQGLEEVGQGSCAEVFVFSGADADRVGFGFFGADDEHVGSMDFAGPADFGADFVVADVQFGANVGLR